MGFFKTERKILISLAVPVVFGQMGHMLTHIADTVMVAKLGTAELAAVSFASNWLAVFLVLGIGLSYGITPLVSKAFAAKDLATVTVFFRAASLVTLLIVGVLGILVIASYFVLPMMGQDPEVLRLAQLYFLPAGLSLIPLMIFQVWRQFAEGLSSTLAAMWVSLGGNLLNIGLNYLLIFGALGAPELGVEGAAIASLFARVVMALVFTGIVLFGPFFRRNRTKPESELTTVQAAWQAIKLGGPPGLQLTVEVGAWTTGMVLIGQISAAALAAHQITLSMVGLSYMMATGIAASATIRVSFFRGLQKRRFSYFSGKLAVRLATLMMAAIGASYCVAAFFLPGWVSDDPMVIRLSMGLFLIGALFQVADGWQAVLSGVLRGYEDVVAPSMILTVSYWVAGLPTGHILATVFGFGVFGYWTGFLLALVMAAFLLRLRFARQKPKPATVSDRSRPNAIHSAV